MAFTDYATGGGGSPGGGGSVSADEYESLGKLKKQYLEYLSNKREEIDEQQQARRYRHGAQYTQAQIDALRKRKQPVVTYNEIGRKINGTVGNIERQRGDPKAFPRTPKHEEGADLATAVLRYAMDENDWEAKSPIVGSDAATDGFGGVEIILEENGADRDIDLDVVPPEDFFYDPRSKRLDFSDARYMGVGKWMDKEQVAEMFPDKAADIESLTEGSDLTSNADIDNKWVNTDLGRVRVVEHWYLKRGEWYYCIYTSSLKLAEGKSYLVDDKNKTYCKYVMFSANVDHDGDRYGLVRQLKSAQDEINARGSKGLHELNTRRIIAEKGAFDDIELARREAARPDGIVERNPGMEALFDDAAKMANLEGQLKFLERAQNRIDTYGPNLALIGGENGKSSGPSGVAIRLNMQAGLAELGPFGIAYRRWKLRVYRAVFHAIQRHWTAERWIRVTDDEGLAQFIQVNGVGIDPMTGMPSTINAIGSLDVDIILDEGPDTVTAMQDMYQTLSDILPAMAPMLQPPQAQAVVDMLIETSPLDSDKKKKFREATEAAQQPDPAAEQAKMAELQTLMEKARETGASADLKSAQAQKTMIEAQLAPQQMMVDGQGQPMEAPNQLEQIKMASEVELNQAKTAETYAKAYKSEQEAMLAPQKMVLEQQNAAQDRAINQRNAEEDRKLAAQQAKQRSQAQR